MNSVRRRIVIALSAAPFASPLSAFAQGFSEVQPPATA